MPLTSTPYSRIYLTLIVFSLGLFLLLIYYASYQFFPDASPLLNHANLYLPYNPWMVIFLIVALLSINMTTLSVIQKMQRQANELKETNDTLTSEMQNKAKTDEYKQKMEIALVQGQKLQAIGTLAGGIAHDFNNILYAIKGYSEMAADDIEKNTHTHKNLLKVLEAAKKGQEYIARILTFSRKQHHELLPLNLKEVINSVLSLLNPAIPSSVTIHFDAPIDAMILGNQTQLHQVLINLINNAIDAMDGVGTINIALAALRNQDELFRLTHQTQADGFELTIKDTGHGINPATASRMFEPFFTTKEVGKGTGLGLSIVHSIIEEHHGKISVTSKMGSGTTFTILLPKTLTQ